VAINTGKVVAGGLAAGVVMNILDYLQSTYVIAPRLTPLLDAVNPSLGPNMQSGTALAFFIIWDFLMAFALVWTYAAMRPRFGAGAGTAMRAGVLLWLVTCYAMYSWTVAGITDNAFALLASGGALVVTLIGAYVGAMIYKEE
jgi:hypothetical protein